MDRNAGFAGTCVLKSSLWTLWHHLLVTSEQNCKLVTTEQNTVEVCDDDNVVEETSAALAWIQLASASYSTPHQIILLTRTSLNIAAQVSNQALIEIVT